MIYPANWSQGLRPSTSATPLSVHGGEKDTIVHHLSKPRGVKKSLKSLPREVKKSLKPLPRGGYTGNIVYSVSFCFQDVNYAFATAGKFNENPSMRALAKILRARAGEHSSNFCEQFEQRRNFASTFKLDGTIRYPFYWVRMLSWIRNFLAANGKGYDNSRLSDDIHRGSRKIHDKWLRFTCHSCT